jgi:hypothetical protein
MIIFLHIPKTAGTSFRSILENSFGGFHCHTSHTRKKVFDQADLNFARKFFPRLRSLAGHTLVDPLQLVVPNPFYITLMREPIARVISQYQDSVLRGHNQKSFEQCLREKGELENLHVKLMAGEPNLDKAKRFLDRCNLVGLTEKFDLSLEVLRRTCPYSLNLHYKRKIVARENAIKKSIEQDPRLFEMAREYNQLDVELYSFAIQEVFPKLCAKAGLDPSAKVASFEKASHKPGLAFYLGRWQNKLFRQVCKFRSRK